MIVVDAGVLAPALGDDHADGDAARTDLTPYAATYVALAEAADVALVTADARLSGAGGVGCTVEVLR